MFRVFEKRDALLDCLMAASVLGALLSGAYYAGWAPLWMSVLLAVSVIACLGLWVAMRRSARPGPLIGVLLAFFATATWFLANSTLGLGMIWLAAIVIARRLGMAAVVVYALLTVCIGSAVHMIIGSSPEQIVVEAVGATLFATFGGLFAMLLHATERAERALQIANAELRERSGIEQDLVLAQERERTARGLHDGLGHRLTAIGLSLEFAEQMREKDPERAWREVRVARTTAGDALDDMRRLVRAMHPLDARALTGAESFAAIAEVFRSSGIDVRVRADGPLAEVPQEQLLVLVRFVQEGLTNVVRHADAERVDISVTAGAEWAEAAIEDDGEIPDRSPVLEGFGLRSLRERSEALGGSLRYGAGPRGFRLRVRLPLQSGAAA